MTTETKIALLDLSLEMGKINGRLLTVAQEIGFTKTEEPINHLLEASSNLVIAQQEIQRAVK